ncbi:hypothetical protein Dip510_000056 [Elusimicrobium posterum]
MAEAYNMNDDFYLDDLINRALYGAVKTVREEEFLEYVK